MDNIKDLENAYIKLLKFADKLITYQSEMLLLFCSMIGARDRPKERNDIWDMFAELDLFLMDKLEEFNDICNEYPTKCSQEKETEWIERIEDLGLEYVGNYEEIIEGQFLDIEEDPEVAVCEKGCSMLQDYKNKYNIEQNFIYTVE